MGLRVSEDEEVAGLDVTQHGERAYVIEESGALPNMPLAQATQQPASTPQHAPATQASTAPASTGGGGS